MLTEQQAKDLKRRHSAALLKLPGVAGVGVERSGGAGFAVTVYLADAGAAQRLPPDLEGHPIRTVVSGPFGKQ